MSHMQLRCFSGSNTPLVQPCFFRGRPCAQLRLQHYARHACQPTVRPAHPRLRRRHDCQVWASASYEGRSRPPVHESADSQQQPSLFQQQLSTLRQFGVAALVLLFGLRASAAHARIPSPPSDPGVATVAQHSEAEQAHSRSSEEASEASSTQSPEGRWSRDTGIQLAVATGKTQMDLAKEGGLTPLAKRYGPKVDLTRSKVPNPALVPLEYSQGWDDMPATVWRPDKLRDMTYTQFWQLISEGRIRKVRFSQDNRHAWVSTKESAPGGARTEKVGLPYDPDLYPFLKVHNVKIEETPINLYANAWMALLEISLPAYLVAKIYSYFNVDDGEEGGRALPTPIKDSKAKFDDIAGVEEIKDEMKELVTFLKDPERFVKLGAKPPSGILFGGPPGTGKTLMARAIAGEAGVPFYQINGTGFSDMYVGLGASKVRDMFNAARASAPCILFIDEFDAVGGARNESGGASDEQTTTINQFLTEMDGFDDNTNVVVMGATNRPEYLDKALTRPGRFDRLLSMPLPNVQGRIQIMQVHAKGRRFGDFSFDRIARATAGLTGAELAGIVNQSGVIAVRQGRQIINESDMFDALELQQQEKFGVNALVDDDARAVPDHVRRGVALYEAARCIIASMMPDFDEISKITACSGGVENGFTFFIPLEDALESQTYTRGYLEARLVVGLAGRCGEKLVLGEGNVTSASMNDVERVNNIAREMVYRLGFNRRLGPVSLMQNDEAYIQQEDTFEIADIGPELAAVALTEIEELLEAAEAKALYGLTLNYKSLEALTNKLLDQTVVTGQELQELLKETGLVQFPDNSVEGFRWDTETGQLIYPGMPERDFQTRAPDADDDHNVLDDIHPSNPYRVRSDLPNLLTPIF